MSTGAVWLFLLLLPKLCWPTIVRNLGCMIQEGIENEINITVNEQRPRVKSDNSKIPSGDLGGLLRLKASYSSTTTPTSETSTVLLKDLSLEPLMRNSGEDGLTELRGPFRTLVGDLSSMTVQMCVERCWVKRFLFAALQDSTLCFCANNNKGLVAAHSSLCYRRCSGNVRQKCGGRVALSVYATGYAREPFVEPVDLSRGLLGCFWAAGWRDWCVSPEMEVRPDGLRPNLGRQEARVLSPKKEIQAIHKPPLVSPRMSALLCTTYCINGPVRHPIAVLMSENTCCCGQSLGNKAKERLYKVDFTRFCTDPCADPTTRPLCVGTVKGRQYISAYRTFDIWPEAESRPRKVVVAGDWLRPVFPPRDNFEEPDFNRKYEPVQKDDLSGVDLIFPNQSPKGPIEDPVNQDPWVLVVDVPGEDNRGGGWVRMLLIILLFCLLLSVALAIVIMKLRLKKRTREEMLMERFAHGPNGAEVNLINEEKIERRESKSKNDTHAPVTSADDPSNKQNRSLKNSSKAQRKEDKTANNVTGSESGSEETSDESESDS